MRMYGRRFAKRVINKKLQTRTESRDAVLWAIDWENRICNVKIQGSNELVTAHFPQNEAKKMPYMREGNAVRVVHRGGIRGYLEVVGHGMAIPTPVSGDFHPAISNLPDGVTEGCQIIPTEPPSMSVTILDGYYIINGVLYSLSGGAFGETETAEDSIILTNETYPPMETDDPFSYEITSEDSTILTNEVFPPMFLGVPIADYQLDPAPTGNKFRYDCFYVGIDGIITYLKGSEASSNPSKPAIPSDTVLIGSYILLWTGVTEITGRHIGMEWEEPYGSDLEFDCIDEFPWDSGDPTPQTNVKVTVLNQYGWTFSGVFTIYLTMPMGTKQIYSEHTGWHESEVSQEIDGSSYTFIYEREQWIVIGPLIVYTTETSPFFLAVAYDTKGRASQAAHHRLVLLTEDGSVIEGSQANKIILPTTKQTLVSASNVEVDWSNGHKADIIVKEDVTFTFTNALDKDKLILLIEQDGTGGWTPMMPASVKFGNEITEVTVDETANKRSYLGFIYHATSSSYDLVANVSGYPA